MPIAKWDEHDPESLEGSALSSAYEDTLREIVASVDADTLARELSDSTSPEEIRAEELTIDDASVILSIAADRLDGRAIRAELLDRILIGMTNAVVDVDTLASDVPLELSGKELQQKIEGRAPMTVAEYAYLRRALSRRGG